MNKILFPEIFRVACHTKNVGPGTTFVAIKGTKEDGSKYIVDAVNKGASTIVLDNDTLLDSKVLDILNLKKIALVRIKDLDNIQDTRQALAYLSAKAWNYPARNLKIIGITGTKGKSTTTFLINHILSQSGYKTALLSTVSNKILDTEMPRSLTTEQPDYLHEFFNICREKEVDYVVMEVAAQAFSLHRVYDLYFDAAIFTNFDLEHGEFYTTMDEYFAAKMHIFKQLKSHAKVMINDELRERIDALGYRSYKTFGFSKSSDIFCEVSQNALSGLECIIANCFIKSPHMLGEFNALNISAGYAVCSELGVSSYDIQSAIESFKGVPGRLNFYTLPNGSSAVIDYAHNPSSFEAVLSSLKKLNKDVELIVVFGAGGERDPIKRPLMGEAASRYADTIILTSDNPRSEDPEKIAQDITLGIPKNCSVIIQLDREAAIKYAYSISKTTTIIVILGKGPDEYQIVKGVKTYFSESKILSNLSN